MKQPNHPKVRSLSHRFLLRSQFNHDAGELAALIHDDFRGVETDGSIVTKQEEIDILLDTEFSSGEVLEDAIIRRGKLMIVIGTATFRTVGPDICFRFTDVFDGGKLLASHNTQLS